jgi:hypothetical protein
VARAGAGVQVKATAGNEPDEDLAEGTRADAVDELFRVCELDVHVQVNRDKTALVLGLAPLEADDNVLVDAAARQWWVVLELRTGTYRLWSRGRGLKGATACAKSVGCDTKVCGCAVARNLGARATYSHVCDGLEVSRSRGAGVVRPSQAHWAAEKVARRNRCRRADWRGRGSLTQQHSLAFT